jgi:hypothetical protein
MPMKAKKPCRKQGCAALVGDEGYCPKHAKNNVRTESQRLYDFNRNRTDEERKMYQTPRWRNFRNYMLIRNPLCQFIYELTGKQCTEFAVEVHHIISPRDNPDLFCEASNVVCVCKRHHPKTTGHDGKSRYVPTVTD